MDRSQHAANQQALQNRVDLIAQWAQDWQMEINPSKSKVMHIGRNNPGLTYSISGMQIDSVAVEKDIGFPLYDLPTGGWRNPVIRTRELVPNKR